MLMGTKSLQTKNSAGGTVPVTAFYNFHSQQKNLLYSNHQIGFHCSESYFSYSNGVVVSHFSNPIWETYRTSINRSHCYRCIYTSILLIFNICKMENGSVRGGA